MNDYGVPKGRNNLKSPNGHNNDDIKTIKKKYEQIK
jgi:hypothetical protein